ncbi:MAG: phage holin family protein [Actinomycetota bacterium]|nr:phage holin family protein [Actinomycetota bacterium]
MSSEVSARSVDRPAGAGSTRIDLTSTTPAEPSLGELVSAATKDLSALFRSEVEMAKVELRDDVQHGIKGGAMFGGAAFLGILGVILLSIALAYGLVALGLHPALAFLIIGAVYLVTAGVLALVGKKQVKQVKAPENAIRTTKETVAVLKGAGSR